jgi:hypothetical protein
MIECSDCDHLFVEPEYWFHDCDGDAILEADFFVLGDEND